MPERGPRASAVADVDVLVVGGSIAGLATALFAARRGLRVVIVEADEAARPTTFDETVARAPRPATPQAAHSHAFLSRAYVVLRQEAPDLLARLSTAGVHTMSLPQERQPLACEGLPPGGVSTGGLLPADDALVVMLSRRTTVESVLREVVAETPGVDGHWGCGARRLLLDDGPSGSDVPHVGGVALDDGTHVRAAVTVDATGRRGDVHRWLVDAGVDVEEEDDDCGIAYHTRFHRLHPGAPRGPLNQTFRGGSSFDRYSCLVVPGDGDTFSVTFGVLPEDGSLRGLREAPGFQAAASQLDVIREWVDPDRSEPISDVRSMTRMRNRIRRLSRDGRPTVTGIVPIADAAAICNPAHSRGCALALWHAQRMADQFVAHLGDPESLARARDEVLESTLAPWVADSRLQDAVRLSRWRPDAGITAPQPPAGTTTNGRAHVAAHHDPVVWHAVTRLQQLLALPQDVLADPEVVRRVRRTRALGLGVPPLQGPQHHQLASLVDQANARAAAGDAVGATA